jgi:chromosome segregation ATPase|tara:strand:- start:2740 stop:3192 length:453 start_codon:yes stop_codon:yes gene_type:complete
MKPLNIALALLPVLIVAIGLIGWVTTLRGDLNTVQTQVVDLKAQVSSLQDESKQGALAISNLSELIKDIDKIEEVVDRVDVALFRLDAIEREAQTNAPAISELEKNLAVANDQMRTIMADHMGFADTLREIGEAGALPSGERRSYGGYGN